MHCEYRGQPKPVKSAFKFARFGAVKTPDAAQNRERESALNPVKIEANFRLHVSREVTSWAGSLEPLRMPNPVKRGIFGGAGDSGDGSVDR
jgi:hypothetical protein